MKEFNTMSVRYNNKQLIDITFSNDIDIDISLKNNSYLIYKIDMDNDEIFYYLLDINSLPNIISNIPYASSKNISKAINLIKINLNIDIEKEIKKFLPEFFI
jgi:hypothetical protein